MQSSILNERSFLQQTNQMLSQLLNWSKKVMSIEDESDQERAQAQFVSVVKTLQNAEGERARTGIQGRLLARLSQLERQSVGLRLEWAKAHERHQHYLNIIHYLEIQKNFLEDYHTVPADSFSTAELQSLAYEDFEQLALLGSAVQASRLSHAKILSAKENHLAALSDLHFSDMAERDSVSTPMFSPMEDFP